MANSNKKPRQGKTPKQVADSEKLAWVGVAGMIIVFILASLLIGCSQKVHVITEDGVEWYTDK